MTCKRIYISAPNDVAHSSYPYSLSVACCRKQRPRQPTLNVANRRPIRDLVTGTWLRQHCVRMFKRERCHLLDVGNFFPAGRSTAQVGIYNFFLNIYHVMFSYMFIYLRYYLLQYLFQDSSGVMFLWKILIMSYSGIHWFFSVLFKTVVEPRFDLVWKNTQA